MGEKKQKQQQKKNLPTPLNKQQRVEEQLAQKLEQEKQKQALKASKVLSFKPSSDVKGLRFGGQLVVKSFTVRRASPLELLRLLSLPPSSVYNHHHQTTTTTTTTTNNNNNNIPFPSTITYLPTNFTILAHHAWHTLTLGLGTKKSKVVLFVFESEGLKSAVDRFWPTAMVLGEVSKKLIRGLPGCEMARFKFRKGCITFYVYAVRHSGVSGFSRADDLRLILHSLVALNDFLDHTAMLALPNQKTICFSSPPPSPQLPMTAH